ncbi:response regulator transcription factor [Viridibacillus sp. NPDC096237]|uniref:response regulator transcription factor n=1 Tax=Viridibacillus sp. NPDC096237 TaxID=3390721 RepID=UPI003CFBFBA1
MLSLNNKKILIIDDEEDILILLKTILRKEGVENVYTSTTASDGFTQFQRKQPDIVLLDIMLPDGRGYDVCKQIRKISDVPILFLSAKAEEIDRTLGLAVGGDDYITKPFSLKEIASRIKAQLRSSDYLHVDKKDLLIKAGPFEFDEQKVEFKKNGNIIELIPKELGLMTHLLKNSNQIISKENLCDKVWGENFNGFDIVHIRKLREKIEEQPSNPKYLITVKGLGYKLVVEEE